MGTSKQGPRPTKGHPKPPDPVRPGRRRSRGVQVPDAPALLYHSPNRGQRQPSHLRGKTGVPIPSETNAGLVPAGPRHRAHPRPMTSTPGEGVRGVRVRSLHPGSGDPRVPGHGEPRPSLGCQGWRRSRCRRVHGGTWQVQTQGCRLHVEKDAHREDAMGISEQGLRPTKGHPKARDPGPTWAPCLAGDSGLGHPFPSLPIVRIGGRDNLGASEGRQAFPYGVKLMGGRCRRAWSPRAPCPVRDLQPRHTPRGVRVRRQTPGAEDPQGPGHTGGTASQPVPGIAKVPVPTGSLRIMGGPHPGVPASCGKGCPS